MSKQQFDEFIKRQITLEQYKETIAKRAVSLHLKKADRRVLKLVKSLPLNVPVADKQLLMLKIQKIYRRAFDDVEQYLTKTSSKLLKEDVSWLRKTTKLDIDIDLTRASEAAQATPFKERTMSKWVESLSNKRIQLIDESLNQDTTASRIAAAKKSIIKTNNYTKTISKTFVNQFITTGRKKAYDLNDVKKLVWVSVLDSRTSLMCQARSQKLYDADTKQPIGHSHAWNGGPGVIHFNCRSIAVPLDENENPDSYAKSYDEWLKTQPKETVVEILGPTRAELFLSGVLVLGAFVLPSGDEINVDELEQ